MIGCVDIDAVLDVVQSLVQVPRASRTQEAIACVRLHGEEGERQREERERTREEKNTQNGGRGGNKEV